MIDVFVIADRPLMRSGLRHSCAGFFDVVGEAAAVGDGVRRVRLLRPQVTIVDLPRPVVEPEADDQGNDERGVDADLLDLVAQDTAIILLLNSLSVAPALATNGAISVVSCRADGAEIRRAVRHAAAGRVHGSVSEDPVRRGVEQWTVPRLTVKESEVLPLVTLGLTNREIAERLSVSQTTVKFHIANLIHKYGANRRTELAYLAAWHGAPELKASPG
ncbi:response regulator transcription factor [Pseudonocardia sp. C8]|uniref:response regulator transcription factor n=1 Tax=Pseudonocardia sp. C8 TaxID=2762759 RepID=UPI0021037E1C|nr:response regulator transcription factor [Pseudonocardia sp. C8]